MGYSYTFNDAVKPPNEREDFFMRNSKTKKSVEISILIALAFILDYASNLFMGWLWPQGGSISISLIPIAIIAFRYGWLAGVMGGFIMGLLQLLTGAYIMHPIQVLFDYPLPYAALGFAGVFANKVNGTTGIKQMVCIWCATGLGSFLRLICHVISGAVFFAPVTGENPWVFSIVYNTPYIIMSYIVSTVLLTILYRRNSEQLLVK